MRLGSYGRSKLSDRDVEFLVETTTPQVTDKARLKQILTEDEDFRDTFISDEAVFNRVVNDEEIFLKISPALFFEILLRRAAKELKESSFTVEKTGAMKVPVFDTHEVVDLLSKRELITYLAEMLASFIKVRSYALSFRVKKGTWRKIQFNDLDLQTMMSFSEAVDENLKFGFYKRIADICLFVLGMFPEYVEREYRYPFSGEVRPSIGLKARISPEEYEKEGRKFYRLAAEHESAKSLDLSDVFWMVHGSFHVATKPLKFISERYLHYKKKNIFPS